MALQRGIGVLILAGVVERWQNDGEDTVMLLSQAMRSGARMHPQFRGGYGGYLADGTRATCAFAAAVEAAGLPLGPPYGSVRPLRGTAPAAYSVEVPEEEWAVLFFSVPCPECGEVKQVQYIVPNLNDDHGWTRERIADWVESIEITFSLRNHPQEAARQASIEEPSELVGA